MKRYILLEDGLCDAETYERIKGERKFVEYEPWMEESKKLWDALKKPGTILPMPEEPQQPTICIKKIEYDQGKIEQRPVVMILADKINEIIDAINTQPKIEFT
jgi:hypothetical protein